MHNQKYLNITYFPVARNPFPKPEISSPPLIVRASMRYLWNKPWLPEGLPEAWWNIIITIVTREDTESAQAPKCSWYPWQNTTQPPVSDHSKCRLGGRLGEGSPQGFSILGNLHLVISMLYSCGKFISGTTSGSLDCKIYVWYNQYVTATHFWISVWKRYSRLCIKWSPTAG